MTHWGPQGPPDPTCSTRSGRTVAWQAAWPAWATLRCPHFVDEKQGVSDVCPGSRSGCKVGRPRCDLGARFPGRRGLSCRAQLPPRRPMASKRETRVPGRDEGCQSLSACDLSRFLFFESRIWLCRHSCRWEPRRESVKWALGTCGLGKLLPCPGAPKAPAVLPACGPVTPTGAPGCHPHPDLPHGPSPKHLQFHVHTRGQRCQSDQVGLE